MRALALSLSILSLLGLALFTGFRPLYFLLYSIPLVAALAYTWAWLQGRGLEVTVDNLSARPQVGIPLQLKITVKEKIGLPRVAMRFKLPGLEDSDGDHIITLQPKGISTWITTITHHRRGLNDIGSLILITSDPLGLCQLSRRMGRPHIIIVYPNTVPLSPGLSVGPAALGDIGNVSHVLTASTSASRVREYLPGDRLSHIHWPSTARRNQLMSKEFDSGGHSEVWIFLDLEGSKQAGLDRENTEEYGITIAASLARSLVEAGQQVGLVTQGNDFYNLVPNRDRKHVWDILTALALVKAEGTTPLITLMLRDSVRLAPGSIAVVIAPTPIGSQATIFQHLNGRGISLVPILLDTISFANRVRTASPESTNAGLQNQSFFIRQGENLTRSLAPVMDHLVY